MKPVWQQDFHHQHSHEDAVSSVGISTPGDLDGKRLNDWISGLLRTKGGDIYRMKGVLSVKGSRIDSFSKASTCFSTRNSIARGEVMPARIHSCSSDKNLDRAALTEGFKACIARRGGRVRSSWQLVVGFRKTLARLAPSSRPRRLRDLATSNCRMQFTKHWAAVLEDYVIDLAWSPDATLLAAAAGSGAVSLFNAEDGTKRHDLPGHEDGTNCLAWSQRLRPRTYWLREAKMVQ